MAVSAALYFLFDQMTLRKSRTEFEDHVNNVQIAIQNQVRTYVDVLRGAAALFYTADNITREQFHAYVQELRLQQTFPGITNLNVGRRVLHSEKQAFEAALRSDTAIDRQGHPDFAVKPAGERPEYHVLTYIEPLESNLVSFGLDIAAKPVVADALALSRDTGRLISSGRLIHIAGPFRHVGLAMRMPLYRRGMPLRTVTERRKAYYGSIGAGFDIEKLISGALKKNTLSAMRVRLYDAGANGSGAAGAESLLFDSDASLLDRLGEPSASMFVKQVSMDIGPRTWRAEFSAPRSALLSGFDVYLPWAALITGLGATLMLYGVFYSMSTARRRAMELAREMTKDLRASEANLAEAQHMARLGSWTLDPANECMNWSAETYRIFGMRRSGDLPRRTDFLERIHESDRARIEHGLAECLSGKGEMDIEHRIVQQNGMVRWVHTICRRSHHGKGNLLRGAVMDVTGRKQTMEALKRSKAQLRELSAHQERVKEDERKRIAREIHDELGQTLLALRIDVSMLDARTGRSHPRLNEKVREALDQIDATVKTIRTIINNLRPAVLDLGLYAAIEWQVAEFRRRTGITCDLDMGDQEVDVDDACATSLFRILQESLTNVIRHANASRVAIELYQDNGFQIMRIRDNGVGIHPGSAPKSSTSFGLVGVKERINALNGEFVIRSAPGQGTTLTIHIPLQKREQDLCDLDPSDDK